ncbi:MAG: protein kinase, partial [Oscillospiraceae bacterium]|nr:protein kinase [Oscillospiraceae bacterium]
MRNDVYRSMEDIYDAPLLPERFDPYTILSCLKHTGETAVYLLARDGARFILKYAAGQARDALSEECLFLDRFSQQFDFLPSAVLFIQTGTESFLLREYIEGETLHDLVDRNGPFEEREAARLTLLLLNSLETLHTQSPPVIHRDIKPENLVLTPTGKLKMIDMGTVRSYSGVKSKDTVYAGTPAVAAPEQFGYAQSDKRTDIYAAGMLLLFLLTGGYERDLYAVADVSRGARRVLEKCLAFDPDRRYQDTKAMRAALLRVLRTGVKTTRTRVAALCALAFILGAVCGVAVKTYLPPDAPAAQITAPQPVVFAEPLLELAVREFLG